MIGMITHYAPEKFALEDKNGRHFKCSEAFVRRFLRRNMGWSLRRATRAGQKVPVDADQILFRACLRAAAAICDLDILPVFVVNTDQTQVV
ncbi:hypothetical protein BDY19DRAFT_864208, partial [Irpex rosettiformis]